MSAFKLISVVLVFATCILALLTRLGPVSIRGFLRMHRKRVTLLVFFVYLLMLTAMYLSTLGVFGTHK